MFDIHFKLLLILIVFVSCCVDMLSPRGSATRPEFLFEDSLSLFNLVALFVFHFSNALSSYCQYRFSYQKSTPLFSSLLIDRSYDYHSFFSLTYY